MKKTTILGIVGGTLVVAGAVAAWFKREAIKETAAEVVAEVKKYLAKGKEEPAEVKE